MKQFLKRLVPLFLSIGIIASIGWYLLVYDRAFTRDMLISSARFFDSRGNTDFAATLYDLAYEYTGQDDDVAIELANQYRYDGNYTKAELTLTKAIADRPSVDLYMALCKTFVEQDKLMDAVHLLDSVTDPGFQMELDKLRPAAPAANVEAGYYSRYIDVSLSAEDAAIYYTLDGNYPTTQSEPFGIPVSLPAGETVIQAISIAPNGLVSPLETLSYTIGGVIEEAIFLDSAIEQAVREALGVEADTKLMTDQIWAITEFTIPADAVQFDDLSMMPYLQVLRGNNAQFSSLFFLSSCQELTELHLSECRFPDEDMQLIAQLPMLEKLTLSDCGLSTVAGLAGAPKLKYLDLSDNALRNLDVLADMPGLKEVHLQHNAVTALTALGQITTLETLDISYNSVSDLSPLAECPSLTWLNAGNNVLKFLSGINTFPALSHLDVDHNLLTDVAILGECTNLKELNISTNQLTDIRALGALSGLVALNCAYNSLDALPAFPEGSALSIVDASYNQIESLSPLRKLEELTYVYMDYNKLTTLDPIAECYRLVMVNAYGNEIEDVSKLTEEHDIIVNYDPT